MWETLLDRMLGHLFQTGRIEVTLPSGRVLSAGQGDAEPVRVRVHDPNLPRRVIAKPDLAVGEAYMDGTLTIENDDLRGFLALATRNLQNRGAFWTSKPYVLASAALRRIAQHNPIGRAQRNVAHHYDLSGELYDLFLDADRQYSCAYFRHPGDTLEQAQAQKKAHIAGKLLLEPGMRVLDIGCGWGGMALTLARDYGAEVLGVTLSREQHAVATERARAEGLADRVQFRLQDYREVQGSFDRIVSVGMFEHVGVPHYREYFRHVRRLLTGEGVALIHSIGRFGPPGATGGFIDKYIFPGGYVPAMSEMAAAIEREELCPTDLEVWRLHYAETLRHWYNRFMANIDKARAIYDERFCRMWRFYLAASEMTFRAGSQGVFQVQLAKNQEAVPLTREYLYTEPLEHGRRHAAE
ncbi:SAM-dependent methyltransferase [Frigidibacter sp. ROC022]|uniref:SAM-dependent methyltransferase n=1 Tax=Frigidibacter sp. ROC022 TaxID=2971796 RepID=UPI00215A6BA4|nr:cyclopropane-fatty-acyl-phospholipid synthase family protein [Frigidibacter sp. ROC022]MCR8726249.1 cyclopropane-fatty-acyl-phospholipid synthase family protein [Frigidibacter sp. ROC022]